MTPTPEERLLREYLGLPVQEKKDRFLTTAEAAELTGVARRTVQWWIESGNVDAIRVGRTYRLCLRSLEKWLLQQNQI